MGVGIQDLRHTCEQDEGMAGYGWTSYDVRNGGIQTINDTRNKLDVTTQFVKISDGDHSGKWGLRIRGDLRADANDHQKSTAIFYLGSEDSNSIIRCMHEQVSSGPNSAIVCDGGKSKLGDFRLRIPHSGIGDALPLASVKSLVVPVDAIWQAKSIFTDQLEGINSYDGMTADTLGKGNLHYVQMIFEGSFEFDVLFFSNPVTEIMTSDQLTEGIRKLVSTFSERFNSVYPPQAPFQDEQHITFSKSLLSNLMGGIGYFYGRSKVDMSATADHNETNENFGIEAQGPFELFSSVPSRPFYPRGFFWDEGFHLQVIMDWDMDLALEIAHSWFDLMDENGWIAREQILGSEARSKVPSKFQTQYPHDANPPTMFLVVQAFLSKLSKASPYSGNPSLYLNDGESGKALLKGLYLKMKKHYEWFRRTQTGKLDHYQLHGIKLNEGYRWRGQTPQHILTSGLDDYPRAQPPHPEELHVDALCWVGLMAVVLKKISLFLSEDKDQEIFIKQEADIVKSVDSLHWSESDQTYCDTTMSSRNRIEKICHKGYISLFPFLTGLMTPHNPHLETILDLMRDPEELWSPYGLRSLSHKDKYYGTDENYWRSPVWININYMAIEQLLVSTHA